MHNNLTGWEGCKNILCIRADNMGDLLMSSPAIRALKETFHCKITLLTSPMAKGMAPFLPEIDEVIVFDVPWVKGSVAPDSTDFYKTVEQLRAKQFDAAVIFTVYSQNPLPAAMMAYLAQIPRRLAYCRENPYDLLTHWVPDEEPYGLIRHQVSRDLDLVFTTGATAASDKLLLAADDQKWPVVIDKMKIAGIDPGRPWIVVHAGVSETKREYPENRWVDAAKQIIPNLAPQVLFTGTTAEKALTDRLERQVGVGAFSVAGLFTLEEFILVIKHSALLVSVNTVSVHIAAATSTPVVVLYALTNPQHLPWKCHGMVLPFNVADALHSKNEVIRYVRESLMHPATSPVTPEDITRAAQVALAAPPGSLPMPELLPLRTIPGH